MSVTRRRIRYGEPGVEKALGALPVIAEFCRRLDIGGIVDRACPVRDIAYATHGQVIEALVANRLTSPTPLVHVEDWARDWAIEEVFDLAPNVLGDDRIGRALDAVAPELAGIVGSIGARAIAEFGIDVARIHWDMTSISLYGAYRSAEADYIEPRFGYRTRRIAARTCCRSRPALRSVLTEVSRSGTGPMTAGPVRLPRWSLQWRHLPRWPSSGASWWSGTPNWCPIPTCGR